MILKNAEVFNGDFEKIRADVKIDGEKISKIGNFSSEDGLDLTGLVVMRGHGRRNSRSARNDVSNACQKRRNIVLPRFHDTFF